MVQGLAVQKCLQTDVRSQQLLSNEDGVAPKGEPPHVPLQSLA